MPTPCPSSAHVDSYYAATANSSTHFASLEGEQHCDVCVIGGGFTGLSSALHLAESGYDVVLLDAERMGWGASGRNGGQLGSGQRKTQGYLEQALGPETAQQLWLLAEESKAIVKARIAKHNIHCDYTPGVLHAAHKPQHAPELAAYAEKLRREYDYPHVHAVAREEMREMLGTDVYHGGVLDTDAGHLHPLNYALGLARAACEAGARLYEGSPALRIGRGKRIRAETPAGRVTADYIVLACNGYLDGLEPRIEGSIMPINNFILATEPLGGTLAHELIRDDVAVADTKFVVDYFRLSVDRRLLFGGGETYTRRYPADIAAFVRRYMLRVYPQLQDVRIDYAWGGTLAITMNRLPCFGRLGPDCFYAQGYSGHGVALSSLAGKLIAEAVAGTAERFDVFARIPQHRFPGGVWLRWPALVAGMFYYGLRDKL